MQGITVKILWLYGLLSLSSVSAAPDGAGKPPPDLSEYVYLHETRNQISPVHFAALTNMCRGTADPARD
jgi:hypothetical protein